jgi:hypothetical protein
MLEHRARDIVIDAIPVTNQADSACFPAATHHLGGRTPNRQDASALFVSRHHGRLVHDYTFALDVHEHGRGAQVDADFL